jgi:hypothetical protein
MKTLRLKVAWFGSVSNRTHHPKSKTPRKNLGIMASHPAVPPVLCETIER